MQTAPDHLIFESAYRANILPLTSVCNVRCIFCSHFQNPVGIETYRIPHRTLAQVKDTLQFINPDDKIVIGESVTKIAEGEPLAHPQIKEILALIRKEFPDTPIQITTNGNLLDKAAARFLKEIGSVEINLSLNSSNIALRRKLMNDNRAAEAVRAAEFLAAEGVPYHGSVMAMPQVTGWDDLKETIEYLDKTGAATVRVFLPGFTRLASPELIFEQSTWQDLNLLVEDLDVSVPVTVEPPLIRDLKPVIRGVIKGSPAESADLRKNDIILSVSGSPCFSRVDAFRKASVKGSVNLEVERNGEVFPVELIKDSQKTGLVMDYDIDPDLVDTIQRAAYKYERVKLLCSELGAPVLQMALERMGDYQKYQLSTVKSRYFGGSVKAAGLLVVSDFLEALHEPRQDYSESQAVFLPSAAFDREGRDLTGESFLKIEENAGQKVQII